MDSTLSSEKINEKGIPSRSISKNIAIVVGHSKDAKGAVSYNGIHEYDFNTNIAELLLAEAEKYEHIYVQRFLRDRIGLAGCAQRIKDYFGRVDLIIELHFNSAAAKATGCEILMLDKSQKVPNFKYDMSFDAAFRIIEHISMTMGIARRGRNGVKELKFGDRGRLNLELFHSIGTTPIAVIVEPCFAHYEHFESKSIIENPEKYANILGESIFNLIWND